jgi:uncharacterized membrane protein
MLCLEKEAVHMARQMNRRVLQRDRARRRDEKYDGRAGPPDCAEVPEAVERCVCVETVTCGSQEQEMVGDWDVIGKDEIARVEECPRLSSSRCTVS